MLKDLRSVPEDDPWQASESLLLPVDTGEEVEGVELIHLRDLPQLSSSRFRYDNHGLTTGAGCPFVTISVKEAAFKDDTDTNNKVLSNVIEHKLSDGLEIIGWCRRPELRAKNGYGILVFDSSTGEEYWFHIQTARFYHDSIYKNEVS